MWKCECLCEVWLWVLGMWWMLTPSLNGFACWRFELNIAGWSINNRTILNCSHSITRRYFFNPFSPKRSIHTGKLPQRHEFANASFVILIRCHFVSPYHVDGSANNVLFRGGHFCEIAGVPSHLISSQVQLEQENSLNSLKRYSKTAWPEGPRHFERKEWFGSEARPAGRRPWQRMKTGEYWNCLSSRAPSPSRAPRFGDGDWESFFSVQTELAKIQCAVTLAIFQK